MYAFVNRQSVNLAPLVVDMRTKRADSIRAESYIFWCVVI
jgi:hypothetical protein